MTTAVDGSAPHRWLACDHVWLGDRMAHDVALAISPGGMIAAVVEAEDPGDGPGDTPVDTRGVRRGRSPAVLPTEASPERVRGVVLPGLVNAHGHVFHRALRGRAQPRRGRPGRPADTFWGWRDQMYALAGRLDPDTLFTLARAVYGEMALAGITTVGEFHYLHHRPDGRPHDDPNEMGHALAAAAEDVGVRLTLLDTLYLVGDVGADLDDPGLDPVQRRFSDGDVDRWMTRVDRLVDGPTRRHGLAIHSVRAVPATCLADVGELVTAGTGPGRVLHAHVAEQPEEVARTRSLHGCSPVRLLADAGVVSDRFTAVHGVWLDDGDERVLGEAGATVCACPTTERDLADGVLDAPALAAAGVDLAVGSDQHAVVDLFAEARLLEWHRRLVTGTRGHHDTAELLAAMTTGGARSLGWPEVGRVGVGAPADLVVVDLDTVRMAGSSRDDLATAVVYAATAADVVATMVAGRWIVREGGHVRRDVVADLAGAMAVLDGVSA